MSGKRAKPKGAPSPMREATDEAASAGSDSLGTAATAVLDRPVESTAVLPGTGRRGRGLAREQRRQRERQRRRIMAIVSAVVLLAVLGAYLNGRGGDPQGPAVADAARTQQTVLLKVGDNGRIGLAVLAADSATGEGSIILLPPALMVDVAGFGTMTLAEAAALPAVDAAPDALADGLGITIDGTWTLSDQSLAQLVDAAGGVAVDVDVDVTGPGPTPDTEVILIPAGSQTLDGASAAVYASFRANGEPEESRMARFDAVVSAALSGLSPQGDELALQIGSLGQGSASSGAQSLPEFLTSLRAAESSNSVVHRSLPVAAIDAGGAKAAIELDQAAADALAADVWSGSLAAQRPGGNVRVLVQNGVGTPGLGASARDQLATNGFTYVAGGNATKFGRKTTVVLITEDTSAARSEGLAIAQALGLSESALRLSSQGQSIADVVVVLGRDYQP